MPYKTPKNCIVHRVELDSKRRVAEIGYRCSPPSGGVTSKPMDEYGRTGPFSVPGGGSGTYPRALVKGVTSLRFRGMSVGGDATMGFVLIPASATCRKEGSQLACKLKGDTSSPGLAGRTRRRKRR